MSAACSGWLGAANSCSDTAAIMPDRRRPPITAGQQRVPRSGTPRAGEQSGFPRVTGERVVARAAPRRCGAVPRG